MFLGEAASSGQTFSLSWLARDWNPIRRKRNDRSDRCCAETTTAIWQPPHSGALQVHIHVHSLTQAANRWWLKLRIKVNNNPCWLGIGLLKETIPRFSTLFFSQYIVTLSLCDLLYCCFTHSSYNVYFGLNQCWCRTDWNIHRPQ